MEHLPVLVHDTRIITCGATRIRAEFGNGLMIREVKRILFGRTKPFPTPYFIKTDE